MIEGLGRTCPVDGRIDAVHAHGQAQFGGAAADDIHIGHERVEDALFFEHDFGQAPQGQGFEIAHPQTHSRFQQVIEALNVFGVALLHHDARNHIPADNHVRLIHKPFFPGKVEIVLRAGNKDVAHAGQLQIGQQHGRTQVGVFHGNTGRFGKCFRQRIQDAFEPRTAEHEQGGPLFFNLVFFGAGRKAGDQNQARQE